MSTTLTDEMLGGYLKYLQRYTKMNFVYSNILRCAYNEQMTPKWSFVFICLNLRFWKPLEVADVNQFEATKELCDWADTPEDYSEILRSFAKLYEKFEKLNIDCHMNIPIEDIRSYLADSSNVSSRIQFQRFIASKNSAFPVSSAVSQIYSDISQIIGK